MFEFTLIAKDACSYRPTMTEDISVTKSGITLGQQVLAKLGIVPNNESFLLNILVDSKRKALAFQVPENDAERKAAYRFSKNDGNRWAKFFAGANKRMQQVQQFAGLKGDLQLVEGTRFWVIKMEEDVKMNEREKSLSEVLS